MERNKMIDILIDDHDVQRYGAGFVGPSFALRGLSCMPYDNTREQNLNYLADPTVTYDTIYVVTHQDNVAGIEAVHRKLKAAETPKNIALLWCGNKEEACVSVLPIVTLDTFKKTKNIASWDKFASLDTSARMKKRESLGSYLWRTFLYGKFTPGVF